MGFLESIGLLPSQSLVQTSRRPVRISSPWTESQLTKFVGADIFEGTYMPVDRATAMRIPGVVKGRALIVGPLARQPLVVLEDDVKVDQQPRWLSHTAGSISPIHRMAYTLDDCIFNAWSLWAVTRAPGDSGEIIDSQRVPFERWRFQESGNVEVAVASDDWRPVSNEQVILFAGPQEGLLDMAADTIRGAYAIERGWINRARTPIPLVELSQTDDVELEDDEIDDLLQAYIDARAADATQPVMFTPRGIELKTHGDVQTDLLIQGRNALRLDIAAFLALPGALLDASMSTASLTYSTTEGKRNELVDYSLGYWADPIAGRLSQDDVVPMGQRVRFDMTDFAAPAAIPTGPVTGD